VELASKIIRRSPKQITLVAPLVSYAFTVGSGTSNIFFPLIPVIYQTAYDNGIRPERPLAASTVASALGITSSPVSAAMAAMLTLVSTKGVSLGKILLIVVPASLVATVVMSLIMTRWGKDLKDDREYQRRLAAGEIPPPARGDAGGETKLPRAAKSSAFIFLAGVAVVILMGAIDNLRPSFPGSDGAPVPLDMSVAIQMIMFAVAVVIVIVSKPKVSDILKAQVFGAGMTAMIALFGIAWLADTFISAHLTEIVKIMGNMVTAVPVMFAVAIFVVAALTTSQSAATRTIVPIGLGIPGLDVAFIVAMWTAVQGVLFLPANGTQLAAAEIDKTGTTKIGKAIVNHSFMIPLLISTVAAVAVGMLIATFVK
jgi:anaerobic C4-dicarboxylate transporter-like protein